MPKNKVSCGETEAEPKNYRKRKDIGRDETILEKGKIQKINPPWGDTRTHFEGP